MIIIITIIYPSFYFIFVQPFHNLAWQTNKQTNTKIKTKNKNKNKIQNKRTTTTTKQNKLNKSKNKQTNINKQKCNRDSFDATSNRLFWFKLVDWNYE